MFDYWQEGVERLARHVNLVFRITPSAPVDLFEVRTLGQVLLRIIKDAIGKPPSIVLGVYIHL